MATIADRIDSHPPDAPALILDGGPFAYGALSRAVRRIAADFARAGLAPGDGVGLALTEDFPAILASLALLRLGCRQVALPPQEPAPLRAALARRLCLVAVVGAGPSHAIPDLPLLIPDIEAALRADPIPSPPPVPGEIVFATSGTTGAPRLMVFSEPMLVDQAPLMAAYGRVFHRAFAYEGNHAKRLTLRSLALGGTELLSSGEGQGALAARLARYGVRRLHLAPQRAEALLAAPAAFPPGLAVFLTGMRVPQPLRLDLQRALSCQALVQYGTTEIGTLSLAGAADHDVHPDTVGPLLPGVDLSIVDEDGAPLPPGETGLLRFRRAGAVAAYLDDPEATARAFQDGWFVPGDVGHLLPCGRLVVAGRRDDMMTLGTIKVLPAEIETVAQGFPGLRDCAAFALRSAAHGDIPMLAAVGDASLDATALLALCRDRLGRRAPRKVLVLSALPRNAQGKVLRRELERMAMEGTERGAAPLGLTRPKA